LYLTSRWFAVTDEVFRDRNSLCGIGIDILRKVERVMARFNAEQRDEQQRIVDAIDAMPNPDLPWEDWNTRGMAIYAASGGAAWGRSAFFRWSAKSSKYNEAACLERWGHWRSSLPTRLTASTIFHYATYEGGYQQHKVRANDSYPPRHGGGAPAHTECDPRSLHDNGSSIAAVMDILQNSQAWRGVLAFDRFSLRVMLMKPMPRMGTQILPAEAPRAMHDVDWTNALAWFHKLGMTKLTINMLHNAMARWLRITPSTRCATTSTGSAPDLSRPCRPRLTAT
jgi:hypothetical protein